MKTDTATQLHRPSLLEAAEEAQVSKDDHWTSNLSKIGMTRISVSVVGRVFLYGAEVR